MGFGFRPTDNELINDHLKRKLRGRVIPELNIYHWEAQTPFEKYNAMSVYPSDGGECFFYCTRDGKKRKTPSGYWKETSSKRTFRGCDGEEIGSKMRKSSFSMYDYHLNCGTNPTIGADQGPATEFVLCPIIKEINPDSPSECLEHVLVTPGCTAANLGDKDKEAIPQVCDPQHNLTEAEVSEQHQLDGSVNCRYYDPDDGIFLSELCD